MNKNDKNKVALITGGTKGIGLEIANVFYAKGIKVIISGTNKEKIAEINSKKDPNFYAYEANFSNEISLKSFLKEVEKINQIDILVNNAGINKIDEFTNTLSEDFKMIQSVNVKAPYEISKTVVSKMKKNKFGRIVNISSIFGKLSKSKRSLYSISKFGLHGLTVALSAELSKKNILTNTVSPGFINTDLTKKILSKDEMKKLAKNIPLGRFGEPQEIAKLVYFLCSEENSYISGQNIFIDGGFTIV